MGILTLLTDFGLEDYYVAAVKGVVLSHAPETTLVDLSHDVPQGDIRTASFLLQAAAPTFPPGTVHLAVVDPGVGSERRLLTVEHEDQLFVAPDNGLLEPFLDTARIRAVDRPDLYRSAPGHTFHGRDRFAPIVAALLTGEEPSRLGLLVDDPVRLLQNPPSRDEKRLEGRVIHIDRFGNLITDIPADWLIADTFTAELAGHRIATRVSHYAELPRGRAALLTGSLGTLEASLRDADLAREWGIERDDVVRIELT